MPNWVKHSFVVTGEAAALAAFKEGVRLANPSAPDDEDKAIPFSFKRILPMPEELDIETSSDGDLGIAALTGNGLSSVLSYGWVAAEGVTTQEQLVAMLREKRPHALALGQKYIDNMAKFGVATWYAWCNQNWETKWDACDGHLQEQADGSLKYFFETAWSFPRPVFEQLAKMFPDVVVKGTVDEEGGYFYGEFALENGTLAVDFKEGTRKGGPYDYGDEDEDDSDLDGEGESEAPAQAG